MADLNHDIAEAFGEATGAEVEVQESNPMDTGNLEIVGNENFTENTEEQPVESTEQPQEENERSLTNEPQEEYEDYQENQDDYYEDSDRGDGYKDDYYEDDDYQLFDTTKYTNKIVKLIVRKKSDTKKFEKFVDKLFSSNVAELKVVENFEFQESEEFEAFESEDTMSILNRYIEESEVNLDKSRIQKMIQEIYQEACELV